MSHLHHGPTQHSDSGVAQQQGKSPTQQQQPAASAPHQVNVLNQDHEYDQLPVPPVSPASDKNDDIIPFLHAAIATTVLEALLYFYQQLQNNNDNNDTTFKTITGFFELGRYIRNDDQDAMDRFFSYLNDTRRRVAAALGVEHQGDFHSEEDLARAGGVHHHGSLQHCERIDYPPQMFFDYYSRFTFGAFHDALFPPMLTCHWKADPSLWDRFTGLCVCIKQTHNWLSYEQAYFIIRCVAGLVPLAIVKKEPRFLPKKNKNKQQAQQAQQQEYTNNPDPKGELYVYFQTEAQAAWCISALHGRVLMDTHCIRVARTFEAVQELQRLEEVANTPERVQLRDGTYTLRHLNRLQSFPQKALEVTRMPTFDYY